MSKLRQAYEECVGGDVNETLLASGPDMVAELFNDCGLEDSLKQVKKAYADAKWEENRSFTWAEFRSLAVKLGFDDDDSKDSIGKTAEATEHAALEQSISKRALEDEFPWILPNELKSEKATGQAQLDLHFVRQAEMVQLQKHLHQKFHKYWKSCPSGMDMNEDRARTS